MAAGLRVTVRMTGGRSSNEVPAFPSLTQHSPNHDYHHQTRRQQASVIIEGGDGPRYGGCFGPLTEQRSLRSPGDTRRLAERCLLVVFQTSGSMAKRMLRGDAQRDFEPSGNLVRRRVGRLGGAFRHPC